MTPLYVSFTWKSHDGTIGYGDGVFENVPPVETQADIDDLKKRIARESNLIAKVMMLTFWRRMETKRSD